MGTILKYILVQQSTTMAHFLKARLLCALLCYTERPTSRTAADSSSFVHHGAAFTSKAILVMDIMFRTLGHTVVMNIMTCH